MRTTNAAARPLRRDTAPLCRAERLEPRRLLSTFTWASATGGSWADPTNWDMHAVPQAGDDVVIDQPGSIRINVSGSVTVNSFALTGDTLALQAGAVLTTAAGVNNGGTLTVAPTAKLAVGGTYTASAGATLSLPGVGSTLVPTANQLADSHFESPVVSASGTTHPSSWGAWGSSYLSRQYAVAGSQSLRTGGASSGASQRFSVTPGASYTLSAYAMTPAADRLAGDEGASMQLNFYDASGAMINPYASPYLRRVLTASSAPGGPLAGSVGSSGWNFDTMTAAAPANAVTVTANLTVFSPSGTGGGSVYWDDPQFGPAAPGPSAVTAAASATPARSTSGPPTRSPPPARLPRRLPAPSTCSSAAPLLRRVRLRGLCRPSQLRRHAQVRTALRLRPRHHRRVHRLPVPQGDRQLRYDGPGRHRFGPVSVGGDVHQRRPRGPADRAGDRHRQRRRRPSSC